MYIELTRLLSTAPPRHSCRSTCRTWGRRARHIRGGDLDRRAPAGLGEEGEGGVQAEQATSACGAAAMRANRWRCAGTWSERTEVRRASERRDKKRCAGLRASGRRQVCRVIERREKKRVVAPIPPNTEGRDSELRVRGRGCSEYPLALKFISNSKV